METSLNKHINRSVCVSSQSFFVLRRIHYSSCTKFVKIRWAPCATYKQQKTFYADVQCDTYQRAYMYAGQGFKTSKYVIPNTALFLTIVRASLLLTNERAEHMLAAICKLGSAIGNLRHNSNCNYNYYSI